jgi:general stress protein 26
MKPMFYRLQSIAIALLVIFVMITPHCVLSQEKVPEIPTRAKLIEFAREVMDTARYCALITIDEAGLPRARVMDPFPPEDDMAVWLGTNPKSRKVDQIRKNPHVMLYYFETKGLSYVTIAGTAQLVDDPEEKSRRWKEGWEALYPNRGNAYLLIEVTPQRLEVFSPVHGINGDPGTWTPPSVEFDVPQSK